MLTWETFRIRDLKSDMDTTKPNSTTWIQYTSAERGWLTMMLQHQILKEKQVKFPLFNNYKTQTSQKILKEKKVTRA